MDPHDVDDPAAASAAGGHLLAPGTLGVWCSSRSPMVLGELARSAFDWIVLDGQHGEFDRRALVEAAGALSLAGQRFAVRVGSGDGAGIGFALDVGASTVIVPQVDSADQARAVVRAAHYPPVGHRSWGPLAPLWGGRAETPASAAPQVAVMIESSDALADVEGIAAVPGVDLVLVGPFDLALSLGVALDDLLDDAGGHLSRIRDACRAARIGVAAFAGTPARARTLAARGITCLAVATDSGIVAAGADDQLGRVRRA
jgi:4-hydroxy-2-oxoheptanedioate aldolase